MKKYLIPILENNLDLVVVKWLAADGSSVEKNQALVELECEKADLTLSAPVAGILWHRSKVSEEVIAGEVIGEVESSENYTSKAINSVVQRTTTSIPTKANEGFWSFRDGWVLASISIGVDPDDPTKGADLSAIVRCGDFLNHAILTPEELSTSLTKLVQHDVILIFELGFELSEKWRTEIFLSSGSMVPLGPIERLRTWLNETTFNKTNSMEIEITGEEHHNAYAQYTQKLV